MDAMDIMQKLSKLYVKGLVHQDMMHQFVVICMDILRELEIAKLSHDTHIALTVMGKEHRALLKLLELK